MPSPLPCIGWRCTSPRYGWTTLGHFVDGFELWLGLLVACVLAAVLLGRMTWLPRAALVTGAAFTLGFGLLDIARYQDTGSLDVAYLGSLGSDAVPVIARRSLPADLKACALTTYAAPSADDAVAWNLGRLRAAAALRDLGTPAAGRVSRPGRFGSGTMISSTGR